MRIDEYTYIERDVPVCTHTFISTCVFACVLAFVVVIRTIIFRVMLVFVDSQLCRVCIGSCLCFGYYSCPYTRMYMYMCIYT